MAERVATPRALPTFAWWLVLCLVGLDYFSTLAYLPSIAVEAAGPLAPLVAVGIVVITLLVAVPIYSYVVGRSPAGHGATGLLDQRIRGWTGKLLLLVLLGFVATDFRRNSDLVRRRRFRARARQPDLEGPRRHLHSQ